MKWSIGFLMLGLVMACDPSRTGKADRYGFLAPASETVNVAGSISGSVTIDSKLEANAKKITTLFIIAKRGNTMPPVAVKKVEVTQFPVAFQLTSADSMAGQALEDGLTLSARLDQDGLGGAAKSGDLVGEIKTPVSLGAADVVIQISKEIP